jgi:hypothetical protein
MNRILGMTYPLREVFSRYALPNVQPHDPNVSSDHGKPHLTFNHPIPFQTSASRRS